MANKTKTKVNEAKRVMTQLNSDPNIHGSEAEQQFFMVNGRSYIVKTDVPVELPAPLAEIVQNANKASTEAKNYARKMAFKDAKPPIV